MSALPYVEAYPKTLMLRDGTQVIIRPLEKDDKIRLLHFFERVPQEERHYLKENVTAPEVIHSWTSNIDFDRIIPIVGLVGDDIIADATLHRSRAPARRHIGELRVVVDPTYREKGLGRRLIRELLEISHELRLHKATFQLVSMREEPAILAAESVGFREVATLKEHIKDFWGNYEDLVVLEIPLKDADLWWKF